MVLATWHRDDKGMVLLEPTSWGYLISEKGAKKRMDVARYRRRMEQIEANRAEGEKE